MPDYRELFADVNIVHGGAFFDPESGGVLEVIDLGDVAGEPGWLVEIGYLDIIPERIMGSASFTGTSEELAEEIAATWERLGEDLRWYDLSWDDLSEEEQDHIRRAYEMVLPYYDMDGRHRLLMIPWDDVAATPWHDPTKEDVWAAAEKQLKAWGAEVIVVGPEEDPEVALLEVLYDEGVMLDWPDQYETFDEAAEAYAISYVY